jgi:hypothetical protein
MQEEVFQQYPDVFEKDEEEIVKSLDQMNFKELLNVLKGRVKEIKDDFVDGVLCSNEFQSMLIFRIILVCVVIQHYAC